MRLALVAPPWDVMVNSYPPLGLGYVAAAVKQRGHEVSIHDFGLFPSAGVPEIVEQVLATNPTIIGITTWTHLYHVCCELAQAFKRRAPQIPVLMGGPHVTIFPAETLVDEAATDFVIFGEGEITCGDLMDALGRGDSDFSNIEGLAWRGHDGAVRNSDRGLTRDLGELPLPDRELMQIERYPLRAWDGEPMTTMMTSRGCPYACTYCFKGLFGRRYITTPNDAIIAEMDTIHERYGITHFYFVDDLFVVNVNRLMEFTQEMVARKTGYRWQCLARVDRLTREHYHAMAAAGCSKIHYGIETGDPEVMVRVDKEATLDEVRNAVAWCDEAGILAKGYFMIGLPGDTEQSVRRTIDLACELPLHEAMFSLTTPFPGTGLWNDIKDRFDGIPRKELFRRASYYYGTRTVSEPMFNLSQLPTKRLIELVEIAEYEFRTRGHRARSIEAELDSPVKQWFFKFTQRKWVKRLGVGPFKNMGKKWLVRQTPLSGNAPVTATGRR
ncbi:MAG: radical SAM protein [Planctomycetes bacterium]|nr:radical SAM protein [Planctomycetota bacterium]